jgi:trimeric autotransporter adhesin
MSQSRSGGWFRERILFLAILVPIGALLGQTFFGGIRGRVVDPASASVPGAKITLIDEATGNTRSTNTNALGEYAFSAVNPSTYRMDVEKEGFKRVQRAGVVVGTQAAVVVDISMEVGVVSQTVEVTGAAPVLEAGKADQGQLVDRQMLTDLPSLGRNTWLMGQISPSVVWVGSQKNTTMHDQSCSAQVAIAGGPIRSNNYLIEGIPITDARNRATIVPTIEAVQEVKMQIETYDAEMGRTGGGMFNSYLKSGANDLHGSGFEYTRPVALFANNYFNNRASIKKPDTPYRNYGGSLGGPVWLPGIYNGKNRTFFYAAGETYRLTNPANNNFSVPTALERTGDFSQSFNSNKTLRTIFDPWSAAPDGKGGYTRTAFSGNRIPQSMINPIGKSLVGYYPESNGTAASYATNNYSVGYVIPSEGYEETVKFDHTFASWVRASFAYMHYGSTEQGPHPWAPNPATPTGWTLIRNVDASFLNVSLTPNPTTVVALRYGFNRFPNDQPTYSRGFDVTTLGFSPAYAAASLLPRFPSVGMQYFNRLGAPAEDFAIRWATQNLLGSVSKMSGRHNFKVGADYRLLKQNFITYGASTGNYSFDEVFTRQNPFTPNSTGSDLASLLLGYPSGGDFPYAGLFRVYTKYYAGYFHDDIRVNPKLTLNLGVRYEFETGLNERDNRFTVGFDRNVVSPIAANISGVQIPDLAPGVTGVLPRGGLMFAGVNGNPTSNSNPTKYRFAPRLGAAWSATSKTVIRGGFGVYWIPLGIGEGAADIGAWGYEANTPYIASNDGGVTPANSLSNPFPNGINQPVGNKNGLLTNLGQGLSFVDQNKRGGYMEQFSVDIQREVVKQIMVSIGYVGSRGRHLQRTGSGAGGGYGINELEPKYYSLGDKLFEAVSNPFYGRGGIGIIGAPTVVRAQLLLPFPQFGGVYLTGDSAAVSRYDSVTFKAQKSFSQGLSFLATYTWSKNRTDAFLDTSSTNSGGGYQTLYDLKREYSLAFSDTPSRFTATLTYELPFGRGKPLLGGAPRWVDYLVGGWQTNVVVVAHQGFPLAITQNNNLNTILASPAAAGGGVTGGFTAPSPVQRPNSTGISAETEGSTQQRLDRYLNSAAFTQTPRYFFGNIDRLISVRAPGKNNWDISIFKTVTIAEKYRAQFRAEAMNAYNTPFFARPNTTWGSPNFGRITSQQNFPRFFQIGVRFYF